jgi:ribonucleoside-diphosphate reductase beta chain
MSLLQKRDTYRPFQYPQAFEYFKTHSMIHWIPTEVSFSEDVSDWKHKMSEDEKNLISKLFRFFVQGDIMVNDAYLHKFMPVLGNTPEMVMMMSDFASREAIHVWSYAMLLDTIGMPDSEFEAFKNYKEMMAKYDYLSSFDPTKFDKESDEGKRELARCLAVYSAFTEGLQLFSSFAILFNFARLGKMKGMGKIVEFSIKDEAMHAEAMLWVFRTFIKENPQIWTDEFKKELYDICRNMVKLEDRFVDLCFKECGDIEGLKIEDLKKYIRYIADRRLAELGLKANYHVKTNPLPWMEDILMPKHTAFFEQVPTDYSKGVTGDWDDAW